MTVQGRLKTAQLRPKNNNKNEELNLDLSCYYCNQHHAFKKYIYYILLYVLLLYIIYLHNTHYKIYYIYLYCIYLGPHLWHMDVPRLGVESELHLLACTSATGNRGLELHLWPTPHLMATSDHLTHWARPGIKPTSSWILVRFLTHWATVGTPLTSGLQFESNYLKQTI